MLNAALSIIYDEHRSLAAVVQGLRYLVGRFRKGGEAPDVELLRAILHYLNEFPSRLHHPKEEVFLFASLQKRTHEADTVIARLCAEHGTERTLVRTLSIAVENFAAGNDAQGCQLNEAVEGYSDAIMRHLAREEHSLLPLARRHLLPEDWVEIGVAFGKNGDPRFEADVEHEYAGLFRRIVKLGGQAGAYGLRDKAGSGPSPEIN